MREIVLSVVFSVFASVLLLYMFLFHYVKVVDGVKVLSSMERPLLRDVGREDPGELARKKVLIYRAFRPF